MGVGGWKRRRNGVGIKGFRVRSGAVARGKAEEGIGGGRSLFMERDPVYLKEL